MSILSIQKKFQKLGNIRIGTKSDRGYPTKLETFRFTSKSRGYVQQIADKWGGEVQPWGNQWEVITKAKEIRVMVPPQDPDNMTWYELWGKSGQQRKCDEVTDKRNNVPCQCDPENRECSLITRLTVILPDIEGVGVWLLSSTGWNAAMELNTAIDTVFNYMRRTGEIPPARLILDPREVKRPGEATKQFVVPVLAIDLPMGDVLNMPAIAPSDAPGNALPAPVDTETEAEVVAEVVDLTPDLESKLWDELLTLLDVDPDHLVRKKIPDIKTAIRRLYQLMEQLGLYEPGTLEEHWLAMLKMTGRDRSHPTELRLGDLGPKKDGDFQAFAVLAFNRAKTRVSDPDPV